MSATDAAAPRRGSRPAYVVLDVEVEADVVELVLVNLGQLAAHEVRVALHPPVSALGGQLALEALPLFRCLGVLRPARPLRVFVDRLSALLEREPRRFRATVCWRDDEGQLHERAFDHDLEAFQGLPTVHRPR